MTMGPDPMTRTEVISGRAGMSVRVLAVLALAVLPHEADESVEEVLGVVGAAAASGWYWTEKAGRSSARSPSTTPSLSPK